MTIIGACRHLDDDDDDETADELHKASEVDRSCLNGCLLFLVVENGVIGALGKSKLRCGNFSISFFLVVDCKLSSAFLLLILGVAYKLAHIGVVIICLPLNDDEPAI